MVESLRKVVCWRLTDGGDESQRWAVSGFLVSFFSSVCFLICLLLWLYMHLAPASCCQMLVHVEALPVKCARTIYIYIYIYIIYDRVSLKPRLSFNTILISTEIYS